MLVILPLYPNTVDGSIYSVNLFKFMEISSFGVAYGILFLLLIVTGALKIVWTRLSIVKGQRGITWCSLGLSVLAVLLLSITRQAYATILIFTLLVMKCVLFMKHIRS